MHNPLPSPDKKAKKPCEIIASVNFAQKISKTIKINNNQKDKIKNKLSSCGQKYFSLQKPHHIVAAKVTKKANVKVRLFTPSHHQDAA